MTTFRPKLWTSVSAAMLLTAATGLAACSGEDGETAGTTDEPAAAAVTGGDGAAPAPVGGGEGEGGEGEGASAGGEAGAQGAFAAVPADSRPALQIAHLTGFVLAAQAAAPAEGAESASALVGQGLAEVFDPSADTYRGLGVDEPALRRAAQTGAPADLDAALKTLTAAAARAGGQPQAVVTGMTEIATGLYQEVAVEGGVDTVEYQHSLGAALSARAVARRANLQTAELDRLVALWPSPTAPEDVARLTPVGQVLAQASRVDLALSR